MEETMWNKLMKLNSQDVYNQLLLFYGTFLPMEVRCDLAEWIENTVMRLLFINTDNPEYEMMTRQFKNDLIAQMTQKSEQMAIDKKIPTKARFDEAIKKFQYMDAAELFSQIAEIFSREAQLLSDFQNGNYSNYISGSREVDRKIEKLKESFSLFQSNDIAKWTKSFFDYQEEFYMINGNNSPLNNINNGGSPSHSIEMKLHTSSLNYLLDIINSLQPMMHEYLIAITGHCEEIMKVVVGEFIAQWKYNQQIYGNNDFDINGAGTEKFNIWCSDLAKIIINLYETIKKLHEDFKSLPCKNDNFGQFLMSQGQVLLNLLIKLIRETIIVEHNPPQVIKTNTRFKAAVKLLIGDAINNKIVNGTALATIVSETEAKNINNTSKEKTCGEIANQQVLLEFKDHSLSGQFKNMLLKNFKRHGKKSCEMVTDEKFAIVFTISMDIYGKTIKEKILSLPIVVTVHGSQESNAWATILWDNAFARTNRQHFNVSETINWKEFAEALSYKYLSVTGRGLTDENLHFLAEKFYNERVPFPVPQDNRVVWSAFCKDKLADRDFTFWEWFYNCLKLTRDHLITAWREGRIIGFIDKKMTEQYLLQSSHGTFILRFSDSALGALSIAWLNGQDENLGRVVTHIQPIDSKGFEVIGIDQRIYDVDELVYLYPNVLKYNAFRIDRNYNAPGNYVSFRTVMRVDLRKH